MGIKENKKFKNGYMESLVRIQDVIKKEIESSEEYLKKILTKKNLNVRVILKRYNFKRNSAGIFALKNSDCVSILSESKKDYLSLDDFYNDESLKDFYIVRDAIGHMMTYNMKINIYDSLTENGYFNFYNLIYLGEDIKKNYSSIAIKDFVNVTIKNALKQHHYGENQIDFVIINGKKYQYSVIKKVYIREVLIHEAIIVGDSFIMNYDCNTERFYVVPIPFSSNFSSIKDLNDSLNKISIEGKEFKN